MAKTDIELKCEIDAELRWDPQINAARIAVSVAEGSVLLEGDIDTYAEKSATSAAVKRVAGVRAVADELTVRISGAHRHSDLELAAAALRALEWDVWVPKSVIASVTDGKITLEGIVDWNYQRGAAERALRHMPGVVDIANAIQLSPNSPAKAVKEKVEAALQRQGNTDANTIQVDSIDGAVTLSGKARSRHAIEAATAAAWSAAGVTSVTDRVAMNAP